MKTPDLIKKALEACGVLDGDCENCPYDDGPQLVCIDRLRKDAIAYIQHLESRLAQAERDAKEMADNLDCSACTWCEYFDSDYTNEACRECRMYNEGFKLRGVCPKNTKEETE